ncbi:MAG: group III truncated hemoglobin [Chitinophagaceae bacterium]|nr:group III truncated hemoglobin [Chitinophagaceae bacterium]
MKQQVLTKERTDIITSADIKRLVDAFYEKVRRDELLSLIFSRRIQNRWPQHLEKIYAFWKTVLLDEGTYFGSQSLLYAHLPMYRSHWQRWMKLFIDTMDTLFEGEKAEEAKWRAGKTAKMFKRKIEYYRNLRFKSLL